MSEFYFKQKSIDCLLTEIAFVGISYGMYSEVEEIIKLLKYLSPQKEHVLILEAYCLINSGKFQEADRFFHRTLSLVEVPNRDLLKVLQALNYKFLYDHVFMVNQLNSILISNSIKNPEAIALAQSLLQQQ